jgi:hypothetical protein
MKGQQGSTGGLGGQIVVGTFTATPKMTYYINGGSQAGFSGGGTNGAVGRWHDLGFHCQLWSAGAAVRVTFALNEREAVLFTNRSDQIAEVLEHGKADRHRFD